MTPIPSVFIIESLRFSDQDAGRTEGQILAKILRMSQKETRYRYIRTTKELGPVLKQFKESNLRYLHVSCHGNKQSVAMTLDSIPLSDLATMLKPYLNR